MPKPTIHCGWLKWDFGEFDRTVSISIDQLVPADKSSFKVFVQIEPPTVSGAMSQVIKNYKSYDLILGWHKDLLKLPNAKLLPFGTCWTKNANTDVKLNEVSFLTSSKRFCVGHRLRHQIYNYLPDAINGMRIKKHMGPPRIERKEEMLESFKYSIIVENEAMENWFTEKLIDCLICKTIPIYWGCTNANKFFNTNGFMSFKNMDELKDILNTISKTDIYSQKQKEIEDNFNKAHEYFTIWDRVSTHIRNSI